MNLQNPQRLLFLDWLRILALLLLIVYHTGLVYVTWVFHTKSPFASSAIEPLMRMSEPWRMSLLFFVSGAASAFMLSRPLTEELFWSRTRFLLLPLVCGIVLIVPPQSYIEVLEKHAYQGSYIDFLKLYFARYKGFCSDGTCLRLPTWNHLWFVPYLWCYTMLIFLALKIRPSLLERLTSFATKYFKGYVFLLLPIAVFAIARLYLEPMFPRSYDLVKDWSSHAMYFPVFLLGFSVARSSEVWERFGQARWIALALALLAWLALEISGLFTGPARHAVRSGLQWAAIVAAVGFALRHLAFDNLLRKRLSAAVFPVYLFHQTFIILGAVALRPAGLHPAVESLLLLVLTFAASFLAYVVVKRLCKPMPWLGVWFGLSERKL